MRPAVLLFGGLAVACGPDSLDEQLREVLTTEAIEPLDFGETPDADLVALGRALFYDKILSGNRDIACGTCHHPASRTGDDLSLAIGTGGTGSGSGRALGSGSFMRRNTPELFNRGVEGWGVAHWDGYVEAGEPWPFPSSVDTPDEVQDDALAVQAMIHVADRTAMRGIPGDFDINGDENTLAYWPDDDLPEIWAELMERLLANDEYAALFDDAFPRVDAADLGFEHAALAIAAYEVDAFTFSESLWDLFVEGDNGAIVDPAKRGALVFYGKGQCSSCHSGSMFSDQQYHNICTPQLGETDDWGRGSITRDEEDRYLFRTPPLRNVSFTGPYMHAGSHDSLEDALRHHLNACAKMRTYDGDDLPSRFGDLLLQDADLLEEVEKTADEMATERVDLSQSEVKDLLQFLESLSDPGVVYMGDLAPESVPSGLPVD